MENENIEEVLNKLNLKLKVVDVKGIGLQASLLREASFEEDIYTFLKANINLLYPSHGGLTDFYVWTGDFEDDKKISKEINQLTDELWEILNA